MYESVCHWVLVCISLVTNDMVIGHLKISSGEISFEVICPFENSVIYVLIVELQVLNILDTSSLSDMWLENIFHLVGGLFIFTFLLVSSVIPTFKILINSNLGIFFFDAVFLVSYLRNHCLTQSHKDLPLFFFSKNFLVLTFTSISS